LSTYPVPQCPKYIEPPKVNVDKHDAGGANGVITGPRLNADIEAWSLIIGVVVLMIFESRTGRSHWQFNTLDVSKV
jgi:hypothetical protein